MASLGEKKLRKRERERWQIHVGPVNPFPSSGAPLTSKIVWRNRHLQSKITKGTVMTV